MKTTLSVALPSVVLMASCSGGEEDSGAQRRPVATPRPTVKSGGKVVGWGANYSGQLGDGTTQEFRGIAEVRGLTDVVQVACGGIHSLVLRSNGTVWAFGFNKYGQLGDGTGTKEQHSPVPVNGLSDVVGIAAGEFHSLAVKADGTVCSWGSNTFGQLGDGTLVDRNAPVRALGVLDAVQVAAGGTRSVALCSDGTVWRWGNWHRNAVIGLANDKNQKTPVKMAGLKGVVSVVASAHHAFAVTSDGYPWAFGCNYQGQLGDGSYEEKTEPVRVRGLSDIVAMVAGSGFSLGLKSDGTVWSWGYNVHGQLGDGTRRGRNVPKQVQGLPCIVAIDAGNNYSLALGLDGTVWTWGRYYYWSQRADPPGHRGCYSPIKVRGVSGSAAISAGLSHALSIVKSQ